MFSYRSLMIFSLILILCTACSSSVEQAGGNNASDGEQVTLLISAAASLSDALDDIIIAYNEQNPQINIEVNYASSGTLQSQIEQGAPADLFFSAGQKQMDALHSQGLVEQVVQVLNNSIVAVSSSELSQEATSLQQLLEYAAADYIAVGMPDTVPAGMYTKQALEHEGLWQQWESQYVYAKDVRQVLAYVAQGNAQLGFLYETDALTSKDVHILYSVDHQLHDPITYPLAVVSSTKNKEAAELFYQYLQQEQAVTIYESYGFKAVE